MVMMDTNKLLSLKPALISAVLLAVPRAMAVTAPQAYCSNQNTGASFQAVYDTYQSMGSCMNTCKSQYAFAILQYKNCWCSNYIPAAQDSTSDCNQTCPGYPSDICGNEAQGLYGYIALDNAPSGTAGASSPAQSTTSSPSPTTPATPATTSYVSTTVFQTRTSVETRTPEVVTSYVTPTPPPTSSPPPPPSTTSAQPTSSSSSSSLSSSSSSSSGSPTPVVQTSVITRSGSVVTQTVTTTPIVAGGDQSSAQFHREGFSSGAVAGIVIGTLLGAAALLFAAFLLWRRRRNGDTERQDGQTRPRRTTSVLSRTGLLSRGRPPSMAEHAFDNNDPYAAGANRHSMMVGAGATVEPSSPLGGSQDNVSSRRHSRPMVYDQRLNPSALFANPEANGSRVSMQDQQDYSRPLGIANPEYRASFDSR